MPSRWPSSCGECSIDMTLSLACWLLTDWFGCLLYYSCHCWGHAFAPWFNAFGRFSLEFSSMTVSQGGTQCLTYVNGSTLAHPTLVFLWADAALHLAPLAVERSALPVSQGWLVNYSAASSFPVRAGKQPNSFSPVSHRSFVFWCHFVGYPHTSNCCHSVLLQHSQCNENQRHHTAN